MKILIELPTWMGDTVMATPAIESLLDHINDVEISLIGTVNSIELFKYHPKIIKTYVLNRKLIYYVKDLTKLEEYDVYFTFRSSIRATLTKFFIQSKAKYQFNKKNYLAFHQVEKYNNFVADVFKIQGQAKKLVIHKSKAKKYSRNKLLGINPGSSYGSAKRWYPEQFAQVASSLASEYDIVIFGGLNEMDIAHDIENYLIEYGTLNYQNLSAKTNIDELVNQIAGLDLFITGDSGPMHLAAAFEIPTIAIFGPTRHDETSQKALPLHHLLCFALHRMRRCQTRFRLYRPHGFATQQSSPSLGRSRPR